MKRWQIILLILSSAIILLACGYYTGLVSYRATATPVLARAELTVDNQAEIMHSQKSYIEALEFYQGMLEIDNEALREENEALKRVIIELSVENEGLELARATMETMLNDFEAVKIVKEILVPMGLDDFVFFKSVGEVEEWADYVWMHKLVGKLAVGEIESDCDDVAVAFWAEAMDERRPVGLFGYQISDNESHMQAFALIGDFTQAQVVFVEPVGGGVDEIFANRRWWLD